MDVEVSAIGFGHHETIDTKVLVFKKFERLLRPVHMTLSILNGDISRDSVATSLRHDGIIQPGFSTDLLLSLLVRVLKLLKIVQYLANHG